MRKISAALFILLFFIGLSPEQAVSIEKNDEKFAHAVKELDSFFPSVTGYVVSVAENSAYTDIPATDGLRPGSELTVYREGGEILHPLTRQVLGRQEIVLGIIRVDQARDDYSIGKIIEECTTGEVRPGDLVRITSRRLKAGVLSSVSLEDIENPLLPVQNELFIALEQSSRFYPSDVRVAPSTPFPLSKENLKELARENGFDLIIHVAWDGSPQNRILNLNSFSGKTGFLLNNARIELESSKKKSEVKSPRPGNRAPADRWETLALDHQTVSLCHGWLTGSPEGELAVTDGKALFVYSRRDQTLDLRWEDKESSPYRILAIDCGDIDGNGLEEVFVTRIARGMMGSFVLEYQGDTFIKKDDSRNYFYRIIKTDGKNPRLFAQEFNAGNSFQKPVIEYQWKEGKYVPKGQELLGVPDIFGFGLADIDGNGIQEVIVLNNNEHIDIYQPSGKRIWTSKESFGGSSLFVDSEILGQAPSQNDAGGLVIKGRVLSVDIDNDNRHELVLYRNLPKLGNFLKNLRIYDRSHIGLYRWDGKDMVLSSVKHELSGYLSDYAVKNYPDGTAELIVGLDGTSSRISNGTGNILIRTLENKSMEL